MHECVASDCQSAVTKMFAVLHFVIFSFVVILAAFKGRRDGNKPEFQKEMKDQSGGLHTAASVATGQDPTAKAFPSFPSEKIKKSDIQYETILLLTIGIFVWLCAWFMYVTSQLEWFVDAPTFKYFVIFE